MRAMHRAGCQAAKNAGWHRNSSPGPPPSGQVQSSSPEVRHRLVGCYVAPGKERLVFPITDGPEVAKLLKAGPSEPASGFKRQRFQVPPSGQ